MKKATEKLLVLGVDGMDPRLTRKYVDEGYMPNVKKLLELGSARQDLAMIGGHPTVTPPMWTTLSTGAYASTHGITGFWNIDPVDHSKLVYGLDSTTCKAEQSWNAMAEAGLRTLVWHWPGSSWPPTRDSEDLMVVDGTQPGNVNVGVAKLDAEKFAVASPTITEVKFQPSVIVKNGAGCVLEDIADEIANSSAYEPVGTCSVRLGAQYSKLLLSI